MRFARASLVAALAPLAAVADASPLRPPHRLLDAADAPPTFLELLTHPTPDGDATPTASNPRDAVDHVAALLADAAAQATQRFAPLEPPFADRRGTLPWPVASDVAISAPFGLRPRTDSNTRDRNTGIAFAATSQTEMAAVAPGIVRFAAEIEGMGLCAVLDHGDGFFTVYARLTELSVDVFDVVSSGQRIGVAGAAVFEDRPEAYFEVRVDGIPVDPAEWLSPRRTAAP